MSEAARISSTQGRLAPLLLCGTILAGFGSVPAMAQATGSAAAQPAPALPSAPAVQPVTAEERTISAITVEGAQRLEGDTVLSYTKLRIGNKYTRETLDEALRELYASELFSDVQIRDNQGALTIQVTENPVINRIVLEGNKRLKDDKILPEIRMAPRQIYTRSKVRADVARIIELYRRQGRFAAVVDPKLVQLDQNRVDIVYEITEGPKSKVRQINIIGNDKFSDGQLRSEMATKQSRWFRVFSSGTTYDPDRLAYDQQKVRQFYLTQGYADFRVVSAVAELTSNKQDFIITYVVEEGDRYKFGDVTVQSDIRDLSSEGLSRSLRMKKGDWYNAKAVEDTVEQLNQTAGLFGYAFADVQPEFNRSREDLTMGITFRIANAPRVYVERIDINGNTLTQDKVVRREFRLHEGDAFNTFQVRRSQDRINSLGFFQERLEIDQKPGSAPDRIVLETNVEEKATGELQLSAGFSSLERFILSASVTQRNFRGMGQELRTSVNYSSYSKSVNVGFTEPYFLDKNIAIGGDIFRQDTNSFNYATGNERNTLYSQVRTGFQLRAGLPITEYLSLALRYGLSFEDVTLDKANYYSDREQAGNFQCDPLRASQYLCDAIGKRTTSSIGYSLIYDMRDNRIRPTRGHSITFSQDFAGLGGNVRYLRNRLSADKYWPLGGGFIFSIKGEAGYIHSFEDGAGPNSDPVRLVDRFFLGEPQLRGFDIRGVGPRIVRKPYLYDENNNVIGLSEDRDQWSDDALGGRAYYLTHFEIEIPLGAGARDMGLRPSVFVDAGAVFGVRRPNLIDLPQNIDFPIRDSNGLRQCITPATDTTASTLSSVAEGADCPSGTTLYATSVGGFKEVFLGDSPKPRVSVGFGVNWNSPFGPFRIDIAKALVKVEGDDTKLVTFNIGTQF
ncbi:outer membrane protein assembly factor BamA [Sphingobium sp. B11D3D]|uniref:outer membrane protein assembly factor BamA n=1 Tax=Sphingobium sp. B11D3D TaxID=2940576 RepID=UPI0022247724|nr:outer membrane protein assembly factor BamA [Sphingobium sp. B11D3D]MCW2369701.1 outer membrane protein insertion porin family [Sphingobium sp. B11D3D]